MDEGVSYQVGNIVGLRGGGDLMCVEEVSGDQARCLWMHDGIVNVRSFPIAVLFNKSYQDKLQYDRWVELERMRSAEKEQEAKSSVHVPWYVGLGRV